MKVVSLEEVKKQDTEAIKEAWQVFFNKIISFFDSDIDDTQFLIIVKEPDRDDVNLYSCNLSSHELVSFLERSKLSIILADSE